MLNQLIIVYVMLYSCSGQPIILNNCNVIDHTPYSLRLENNDSLHHLVDYIITVSYFAFILYFGHFFFVKIRGKGCHMMKRGFFNGYQIK